MTKNSEFTELNLHPDCENSSTFWANASTLESWWQRDPNGSYISNWNKSFTSNLLTLGDDGTELYLCTPCAQIIEQTDGNAIYVQNGAHRLRYLLDCGLEEVPVSIYRDVDIEKAGTGLILRPLLVSDTIKVPADFDVDLITEWKLSKKAAVHGGVFHDLFKQQQSERLNQ